MIQGSQMLGQTSKHGDHIKHIDSVILNFLITIIINFIACKHKMLKRNDPILIKNYLNQRKT